MTLLVPASRWRAVRQPCATPRLARGLTLIEVVVALGVVVMLFASVVWGVGALTGARAKESAGELANIIRSLYDAAALSGRTCRLVFELPEERESAAVTYHAECAKTGVTVGAKREDELRQAREAQKDKASQRGREERLRRSEDDDPPSVEELQAREKSRVEEAAKFSSFVSEDVPARELPENVKVEVWTSKVRNRIKHGPAYLYFFPQGFTERAQVVVRQGDNAWTISVQPLTGKTVIASEELEVPRS